MTDERSRMAPPAFSTILRRTRAWGSSGCIFPWGLLLQAMALVHFVRRRPDTFWLWIIVFLGPLGAAVYIAMEVVPDLGLLRLAFDASGGASASPSSKASFRRTRRPATSRSWRICISTKASGRRRAPVTTARSRCAPITSIRFTGVASPKSSSATSPAAVRDLEVVTERDVKYDLHRAAGLLAHAYANTNQPERADALFRQVTDISTASETYFNYAAFLAAQGRTAEARDWVQKILAKKPTMPRYLQRRERPWFRKANALLKRIGAG